MESFLSRYRNALVLIAVLMAQVLGLAVQVRRTVPGSPDTGSVRLIRYWVLGLVSPPERAVHGTSRGARGLWANYLDLIHTRKQNEALQAEVDRLRMEQASLAEDALQGKRLQQLLGFQEKYIYKTVAAQVIGTSGTEQSRMLLIDKGSRDGITPDMPVITPDGVVGRTRDVFAHTSQVLLISDSTSGAGVILATTRIRGILRGNALGQPQIINIMPDDRIKAGEPVITSGGDQIFPRGLPVGHVDRMVADPDHDPLQDVIIRPAANLARLEEVLVITETGETMPKQQRRDVEQAALDNVQKRASDILAERLPSRIDPDATQTSAEPAPTADLDGRPMRPPAALHADRYTPDATPPASTLVPGARIPEATSIAAPAAPLKPPRRTPEVLPADGGAPARNALTAPSRTPPANATGPVAVNPARHKVVIVPPDGSEPPAAEKKPRASTATAPVAPQGDR